MPVGQINDEQALQAFVRDELDRRIQPRIPDAALVTALPAAPYDGQEVFYVADGTNGVVWRLRYRAASASSYKWEYVGGPPLMNEVATGQTTTSTTYAALGTAGPSVTVPLAGDYSVEIGAGIQTGLAASCVTVMSYDIGGTGAVDGDGMLAYSAVTGGATVQQEQAAHRRMVKSALAAATALTAKYKTSAGTATFRSRWMAATPVRVG